MAPKMTVTFLGTSSGGGPSESRNCSALVCDMLGNGSLWMVDCAEGTTRQFSMQPNYTNLRIMKVAKIFITHMHADHIMGIVPLLRNVLFPPRVGNSSSFAPHHAPSRTIEIYGPAGLRLFVRQIMKMTLTRTSDTYVVHELLTVEDAITPCDPPTSTTGPSTSQNITETNVLHCSELPGLDIRASSDGFWRGLTQANGHITNIVVDAGSINHRDPCIGYTFTEVSFPSRKLVILGDTYDPSPMIPLCVNPSPSLLVHEATDSHISHHADSTGRLSKRTASEVLEKALARGHSVPEMAGAFAKLVGTRDLVLNHIGGRFPAPRNSKDYSRHNVMQDIENNASRAWGPGKHAKAAWDFMRVEVPYHPRDEDAPLGTLVQETEVISETIVEAIQAFRTGPHTGHRGRGHHSNQQSSQRQDHRSDHRSEHRSENPEGGSRKRRR